MKIPIIDLMDYHFDNSVKMDVSDIPSKGHSENKRHNPKDIELHEKHTDHRSIIQPMLVMAASLLMVVMASAVLYLRFIGDAPQSGSALAEGESIPTFETTQEPEPSPIVSDTEESVTSYALAESASTSAQCIRGTMDTLGCYGNLIRVDGTYYSMRENGPEQVELENLHTTVDLYGSWDVNIDYKVVDGELVLHDNNMPVDRYAYIEGEKVYFSEYAETEDMSDVKNIEWITPDVATVTPLDGNVDTIMLTIRRTDKSIVENCHYPFFYNLSTGEISDPLSKVPDLFSYGNIATVQFNSSCTRAIISVFGVSKTEDDEDYLDGQNAYVCDLNSGEMTLIEPLLKPYFPDANVEGTEIYTSGGFLWADDDSLLFWEVEAIPTEALASATAEERLLNDLWDRHPWLFSYNVATGELNYKVRDVDIYIVIDDFNQRYLNDGIIWDNEQEAAYFRMVDTSDGTQIVISKITVTEMSGSDWDKSETRAVFRGDDGNLYMLDDVRREWIDLSGILELPDSQIQAVNLVSDYWLCLAVEHGVYCYYIPENLDMQTFYEPAESASAQNVYGPVLVQEEDSWSCKVYNSDSEDYMDIWYMYRVPVSSYERWPDSNYPEWESSPILSEIYQIGKDETYIYLMDAPTSVSELYCDSEGKELFYQAQLDGKQYIYDIIESNNIQENPYWETLYVQCFLIDPSVDFDTAYTTITDSKKGLAYLVPMDRQDCYVFSENENTCVERIACYNSSYLSLDIGSIAQWTIKRVPVVELEFTKENDATFCCTLGCDESYAYYLSLTTGLRWLENDSFSKSRYRTEMQEGNYVIAKFLDLNDIAPDSEWVQRFAAEYAEP